MVARLKRLIACSIVIGAAAPTAHAQLADCPAISGSSQAYKVVLDELHFATPAASNSATLKGLRELLAFNLALQLAEFQSDLASRPTQHAVALSLINCAGRRPSVDGSEFSAQRAETLSDQRVVLELWGTLLEDPGAGAVNRPHAVMGYVIPPLLHTPPAAAPAGKQLVVYPGANVTDVTGALHKLPEASALALLGLALKAQKSLKYDLAVWAFGRSETQIRDAQVASGLPNADVLIAFVRRSACQTRQEARNSDTYEGPLKLLPAEACGDAT
jgi:hypothetical protein